MTKKTHYDGTSKIAEAIAALYGLSPKSKNQISVKIREAKDGLGITSGAKVMPNDVKLKIYNWHCEQLNPVQDIKQDNVVQDVKHGDVQDIKPDVPVQLNDDYAQLHFGVTVKRQGQVKRTTVMLEGYLVKALGRKHGLTDNAAIRAWIEQAIQTGGGYDDNEALTKQVKRMIVESFV